jgi:2-oxo-3-hexenedioate decarboxylase
MPDLEIIAKTLDEAAKKAQATEQLSAQGNDLSLEQAYQVQGLSIARRIARGEKKVGIKMGFTSKAKMIQMGVDDLIWGVLTDKMTIAQNGYINLANYVHPRAEPEIAFLLKSPLSGEITMEQAQAAVEAVAPAIEIIDSRYKNFKFSLEDVIADNSSSSSYVIGNWHSDLVAIDDLDMTMSISERLTESGSSNAILGDPWLSLMAASRLAGAAGQTLEAGEVVLAGAATAAVALQPGDKISLTVENLGTVGFNVEDSSNE